MIACLALVYDTVAKHPRIGKEEVAYIMADLGDDGKATAAAQTSYGFLKKRVFWLTTVVYAVNISAYWGTMQWLPTYLKASQGISLTHTGWLAGIPSFVGLVFLFVFPPLMDKYNFRSPATLLASLILTASMIIVAGTGDSMVALTFISLGYGCIAIANMSLHNILQNNLEGNEIATSIGVFTGIAYVFSSAFPYLMGFLYSYSGS